MNEKDVIASLIDDIMTVREHFLEKYHFGILDGYNLKRKGFSDIKDDYEFLYGIVPDYLCKLDDFMLGESSLTKSKYDIRYRVKHLETLYPKINQYARREKRGGKIPLKKGLNDFLGVRIILPNIIKQEDEILAFLKNEQEGKINRAYLRIDGSYRAIHCYFAENNFTFPWELQIWDVQHKNLNYYDHLRHEDQRKKESEGMLK